MPEQVHREAGHLDRRCAEDQAERATLKRKEAKAAAMVVMPAKASGTVRRNRVQAMLAISNRLKVGEVPGLWSVDTARGTPASRSA